ncbi:shikimate dehydrogenase [Motilibacter peucedani]|uniref:Shikimate dehydrogenase n=1 Tax=Motilibacter peucedani TaxID=598650 RepID=A0A420XU27_9ACTN|nr:shikimate dehydrogenase [Motilibacter peucedani]RKS80241.1 shikimate dehydrogenase [Motilibacter peucedani]
MTSPSGATRLFPIVGDPIEHVESPARLSRTLLERGYDGLCVPLNVASADFDAVMAGLAATRNVDGVLVTMPHKAAAFAYCSTSSQRAQKLGVVSILRRNADGSLDGDMLDGLAFVKAQIDHGAHPDKARALLLGAGAAGSAIALALLDAGVRELVVHDTDDERAAALVNLVSSRTDGRATAGPPDPTGCDLVCNATPLGMDAGDPLPVDLARLTSRMFVGDVVSGHGPTPLLRAAHAAGCLTANGGDMVEAAQHLMADFLLSARHRAA